jgi:hypothetical protein
MLINITKFQMDQLNVKNGLIISVGEHGMFFHFDIGGHSWMRTCTTPPMLERDLKLLAEEGQRG